MAPKTGLSLRELMKTRNKAPSPKDKNKSKPLTNPPPPPPPSPQIPADLGLKPNPNLKKKRQMETAEEGELGPSKGSKQPKQSQDHRSRSSNSVDNREEPPVAQVRRPTRTWSPVLEVDGIPITYDTTLRHYRGGHAGLVAEALEQPLLLPQDMEAYRTFNHLELFLSLKRDLAIVSDSVHLSSFILISLYFIVKVIFYDYYFYYYIFFYFLGHTTSFCGRRVGKELP